MRCTKPVGFNLIWQNSPVKHAYFCVVVEGLEVHSYMSGQEDELLILLKVPVRSILSSSFLVRL